MAESLHEAAGEGDVAKIRTLLNKGARVNTRNKYKETPLHVAALKGHVEVIRALLEAGADVNARAKNKRTLINILRGKMSFIVLVDARAKSKRTPLHLAALYGHVEAVRALLKAGANVNAKDRYRCGPVDYARRGMDDTEGSVAPFEEAIEVLQEAGGRPLVGCINSANWRDWLHKGAARWWGVSD